MSCAPSVTKQTSESRGFAIVAEGDNNADHRVVPAEKHWIPHVWAVCCIYKSGGQEPTKEEHLSIHHLIVQALLPVLITQHEDVLFPDWLGRFRLRIPCTEQSGGSRKGCRAYPPSRCSRY